jgi:hypothetical protein
VAELVRTDPARLDEARARIRAWRVDGGADPRYAEAWAHLLELPLDELCAVLIDPGQRMRDLRQSSPFAGFLDPRERWRILREIDERADS